MPSRRGARRAAGASLGSLVAVAVIVGCAVPPDYPPDEEHLTAEKPQVCFDCHVDGSGPRPHPSHFEEDGSFKLTRRNCNNCHQPGPAEPDSTAAHHDEARMMPVRRAHGG